MHNGAIRDFPEIKRELVLAVDPSEDDPPAAVAAAVGLIEEIREHHGIADPIQMTVATTDGSRVWSFRYSSEGRSRSLFYSNRRQHPARAIPGPPAAARSLGRDETSRVGTARRPRRRLERGPESSYCVIDSGRDELHPFTPRSPSGGSAA
jgi:hypothetical protein